MTLVKSTRGSAPFTYWYGPESYTPNMLSSPAANMFGRYEWISQLNNVGSFTPGIFRANPVIIGDCFRVGGSEDQIDILSLTKAWGQTYRLLLEGCVSAKLGSLSPTFFIGERNEWHAGLAEGSLQKAYAKLREPEWDLGIALGEFKETVSGLVNIMSGLRTYIRTYRKLMTMTVKEWQVNKSAVLDRRSKYAKLNALGASWLEWRLGVYPLIKSLEDLWEQLHSPIVDFDSRLRRRKATLRSQSSDLSMVELHLGSQLYLKGTLETQVKTRATTSVFFNQLQPLSWGERYGTDLGSIPNVLWELTRLSFVIDRFIRIGDYLSYIRGLTSGKISIVGTSTSVQVTRELVVTAREVTWPYAKFPPINARPHCIRSRVLERRVNLALPLTPVVNWKDLSLKQWFDHAALIWQAIPQPNWKKEMQNAYRLDVEFVKSLPRKSKFKIRT